MGEAPPRPDAPVASDEAAGAFAFRGEDPASRIDQAPRAAPRRLLIGGDRTPLVAADGLCAPADRWVAAAEALGPFPASRNYYPGLRRVLGPHDGDAWVLATSLIEAAAPLIGGGFGADGFDLIEASLSIVTTARAALAPPQRAPHFDATDPKHLALLAYLGGTNGTGTGFFRHRATGIERVSEANLARFVAAARADAARAAPGYVGDDDPAYALHAAVAARPGRIAIYPGSLLHSGLVPPGAALDADPRRGRLTCNVFLRLH